MAELGSGNGTDYPATLDTYDTTVADSDDDVKADHMNDVNQAVVAIEGELGTDPAGSASTLTARLAVEHNADGTHSDLTADSLVLAGKLDSVQASIASATTVNIGAAAANSLLVTGTTTITGFDTVTAGIWRFLKFSGALTLTHNGTSLILPGAANITTVAGDTALMVSEGSGNWRCHNYMRATYQPGPGPVLATEQATTSGTAFDFTGIPAGAKRISVILNDVSLSGTDNLLIQIGDSGGIEATDYSSVSSTVAGASTGTTSSTSGFIVELGDAARGVSGILTIERVNSSHLWVAGFSAGTTTGTSSSSHGGGYKTLSAELTQLRLTRTGTDTFVAGSVNVMYE